MKLFDIINTTSSLYNTLGKTGGTALPGNDRGSKIPRWWDKGDITRWMKNPPYRKNGKRINEEQRGGEYDPAFAKFGNPEPSQKENKRGWAKTTGGDSVTVSGPGMKTKKIIARKAGKSSIETIDDEGNRKLYKASGEPVTGNIDYKNMHTEGTSGVGPAGLAGATMPPGSGPSELEYDLSKVDDEFKGKDTRGDIKKSKAKRITLKQYLQQRTNREVDRVTAGV